MANIFNINRSIPLWSQVGHRPARDHALKAIALGVLFGASLLSMPGAHESHRELAHGLRMAARLLTDPQGKAPLLVPEVGFVGREPTRSPTVSANLT
jgi:hypothetical protein